MTTLTEELVRALRAVLAKEMIYTGATETTLEQSGYYPDLMEQINAALSRYEAEKDATGDDLLGFVTRMVWRKPELSDHEIVEAIRYRPDVKDTRDAWEKHGHETGDEHLLSKLRPAGAAMPQIPPEIEALREMSAKASQGEWAVADWQQDFGDHRVTVESSRPEVLGPDQSSIWPDGIVKVFIASTEDSEHSVEDAGFIAASVNAVRKLLGEG